MLEEKERYSFEDIVHIGQYEEKNDESGGGEDERKEEYLISNDLRCNIKANFFGGYLISALFRGAFVFVSGIYLSSAFSKDEKVGLLSLGIIEKLFFSISVSSKMADAFEHINTFKVYDQHFNDEVIDGKDEFSSLENGITHNIYWTSAGIALSLLANYLISFQEELDREIGFSLSFVAKIFPYLCSIDICQFLIAHKKYSFALFPMLFYTLFEGALSILPFLFDESKSFDINLVAKPIFSWFSLIAFCYLLKSASKIENTFCFLNVNLDKDIEKYYGNYHKNSHKVCALLKSVFTYDLNRKSILLRLMMAFTDTLNFLPTLIMIYTISCALDKETFENEVLAMNVPIYAMKAASSYLSAVSLLGTILFRQYCLSSENDEFPRVNIGSDILKYVISNAVPIVLSITLMILYSSLLDVNTDMSNIIFNASISLLSYSFNHIIVAILRGFYSFLLPISTGTISVITHVALSNTMQLNNYENISRYFEYSFYIYLGATLMNAAGIYYAMDKGKTRVDASCIESDDNDANEISQFSILSCCNSFFRMSSDQDNHTFDQGQNPESNYSQMQDNNMEYV